MCDRTGRTERKADQEQPVASRSSCPAQTTTPQSNSRRHVERSLDNDDAVLAGWPAHTFYASRASMNAALFQHRLEIGSPLPVALRDAPGNKGVNAGIVRSRFFRNCGETATVAFAPHQRRATVAWPQRSSRTSKEAKP
jgi:hypothetical protein